MESSDLNKIKKGTIIKSKRTGETAIVKNIRKGKKSWRGTILFFKGKGLNGNSSKSLIGDSGEDLLKDLEIIQEENKSMKKERYVPIKEKKKDLVEGRGGGISLYVDASSMYNEEVVWDHKKKTLIPRKIKNIKADIRIETGYSSKEDSVVLGNLSIKNWDVKSFLSKIKKYGPEAYSQNPSDYEALRFVIGDSIDGENLIYNIGSSVITSLPDKIEVDVIVEMSVPYYDKSTGTYKDLEYSEFDIMGKATLVLHKDVFELEKEVRGNEIEDDYFENIKFNKERYVTRVNKVIIKEAENETEKAKKAIKAIIETDWGGSNESQYKNIQLMSGLAGNNSDVANKFLKKINDFTSKLKVDDFSESVEDLDEQMEDPQEKAMSIIQSLRDENFGNEDQRKRMIDLLTSLFAIKHPMARKTFRRVGDGFSDFGDEILGDSETEPEVDEIVDVETPIVNEPVNSFTTNVFEKKERYVSRVDRGV